MGRRNGGVMKEGEQMSELNSQQRAKADYEYNKAKLKRLEAQIEELQREAVLIKDNLEFLKTAQKAKIVQRKKDKKKLRGEKKDE